MRKGLILLVATMASLTGRIAGAQTVPSTALPRLPGWDTGFSLGVSSDSARDEGNQYDDSSPHFEGRVDLGRYWTQHLKTEFGVSFLNRWETYDYDPLIVPGVRDAGYVSTEKSLQMTVLTPTFTYQLLENEFVHPYLSAGLRVGLLETHARRYEFPRNVTVFPVVSSETSTLTVLARPVVSGGFKSYFHAFNARTFMRTEGSTFFDDDGRPRLGFRVGFGVDF